MGEYISVSSQRDAERADIEQERLEQLKGPAAQVGSWRAQHHPSLPRHLRWRTAIQGARPPLMLRV